MKFLVIGSGGYMGSHFVQHLLKNNIPYASASSQDELGINPATGLWKEPFSFPDDVSTIVYFSQSPHFRDGWRGASHVMAVNSFSVVKAVSEAIRVGAKKFIFISTGSVYSPSFKPITEDASPIRNNWYALSKLHAEEALALFKNEIEISILRPFGVFGPGQRDRLIPNLISSVKNSKPIIIQKSNASTEDDGGFRTNPCYIEDAVRMIYEVALSGHTICANLAGEEVLSVRDIGHLIGTVIGKEPLFDVSDTRRSGDLIGDVSLLKNHIPVKFTPFVEALKSTISAEK